MFKKLSLLLGLVAALPASSFAWVGGPFDGGDYSQLLDDRGIYQASLRFKNGSGFSQFGVNVDLAPRATSTGSSSSATTSVGSYINRCIIYYRGVTYFGNATGIVDHDAREVNGYGNASSWVTLQTSSAGSDTNGASTVTATSSVVYNSGLDNTANFSFKADITSTHPELRFAGKGELQVLSGNALDVITIGTGQNAQVVLVPNPDNLDYDKAKMTVYGARKFFLSSR